MIVPGCDTKRIHLFIHIYPHFLPFEEFYLTLFPTLYPSLTVVHQSWKRFTHIGHSADPADDIRQQGAAMFPVSTSVISIVTPTAGTKHQREGREVAGEECRQDDPTGIRSRRTRSSSWLFSLMIGDAWSIFWALGSYEEDRPRDVSGSA